MSRRILLAGATGVVGRPLARRLLARGHAVRALVRDATGAGDLAAAGAEVVTGDVFDPDAAAGAADGCEVIVHAALRGPAAEDAGADRLRREGTAVLLAAAERAGAAILLPSLVALYADGGQEPIEAADPVMAAGPALAAPQEAELATFGSGARFLILRQGVLFGAGTGAADDLLERVAASAFPVVAGPPVWLPLLHPGDFAEMATTALERDLNGVYDTVSDAVPASALAAAAARALGVAAPPAVSLPVARERLGPDGALTWTVSRRVGPGALATIGIAPSRGWETMLADALAARAPAR